ncbi:MAG: NlpC/P60 family protein [Actinomycetota bacterium]|nr:NlpC/P60 family protein [Actinomycetota bacterium]
MTSAHRGISLARVLAALIMSGTLAASTLFAGSGASFATPSQTQLTEAQRKLDDLVQRQSAIGEQLDQAQSRLTDLQAHEQSVATEVDQIKKQMAGKQEDAIALAKQLYEGGGSSSALEAVLGADSLDAAENRLQYLRSSQAAQVKVFESLAVSQKLLDHKLAELDQARRAAQDEADRLSSINDDLNNEISSTKEEMARLQHEIDAAAAAARRQAAAAAAQSIAVAPVNYAANPAPAANPSAQVAVQAALSQVGKPYQWGAAGPNSYDCSGLTMWAWAHAGVSLPHSSAAQYSATARVPTSALQPGDLVFYYSPIHHVAMYIGNGQMVEAPYTGSNVRVVPFRTSDLVGAGRP